MGAMRLPDTYIPAVREEGGSLVITIPAGVRDDLDLEAGEAPVEIEADGDERRFSCQFDG